MNGIFNIDKPVGMTSFAVVARVRRLSGERRVGHGGTLDPRAGGVLPVLLGDGTRLTEFLAEADKTYLALVELGVSTDTYDGEGRVTASCDPSGIEKKHLEQALKEFSGEILQEPPMYSAVKHKGKRLYELARAGVEVERKPRPVTVRSIAIKGWQSPLLTMEVVCGKGTYIRSLAHDLGASLGCGAYLKELTRTVYGPFDIKDAVALGDLEAAFADGTWERYLKPIDTVLGGWGRVEVDGEAERVIRDGGYLKLSQADPAAGCLAAYGGGALLALLSYDEEKGKWHPDKVFL